MHVKNFNGFKKKENKKQKQSTKQKQKKIEFGDFREFYIVAFHFFFLDRENRIQFLNDVIKKRFIHAEGKFVTETDILLYIEIEYWRNRKGTVHGEVKTDLIECFQHLYPGTQRRKVGSKKGKKVYPYYR